MVSWINEFFGQTPNASEHGGLVDHMLGFVHWFMLALFVGWSIYLVLAFTKFRASRNAKADYQGVTGHATTHIEIGVVIVEAILLLGFAFRSGPVRPMTILSPPTRSKSAPWAKSSFGTSSIPARTRC